MQKQLGNAVYWIGIVSTVLALITRGLAVIGIWTFPANPSGNPISYKTFLDGAMLFFFVMAIASSVSMWAKSQKS